MKTFMNWGTRVALVYALFVSGTLTMVVIAVRHKPDLVSPDYYAQSLEHDRHSLAVRNADALGTTFSMRLSDDTRTLLVEGPASLAKATGTITLYRASDSSADRTAPLAVGADGRQKVSLDGFAPGAWSARASWTLDGTPFFAETRVVIR